MRILAAFSVVCIHFWILPGSMISRYIIATSRFAVPFFFMITGFFLQSIIDRGRFEEYMKKIISLTIGANILYLVLEKSCGVLNVNSIKDLILQLLGVPIWETVIWYLFALIYSCISIKFIYNKWPWLIKFLPLLLIGYFCMVPYSVTIIQQYGWHGSIVTNNFILEGIPLIALGWNMHPLTKWKINWKTWVLFALIFTVTSVFESRMVNRILHAWIQLYFSTVLQTICIMMAALTYPQANWHLDCLSKAGRKYATYIYIFSIQFG